MLQPDQRGWGVTFFHGMQEVAGSSPSPARVDYTAQASKERREWYRITTLVWKHMGSVIRSQKLGGISITVQKVKNYNSAWISGHKWQAIVKYRFYCTIAMLNTCEPTCFFVKAKRCVVAGPEPPAVMHDDRCKLVYSATTGLSTRLNWTVLAHVQLRCKLNMSTDFTTVIPATPPTKSNNISLL